MSTIIALDDVDSVKRASAAIKLIDPSIKVIARVTTDEEKAELENFEHELVLDGNTQTATVSSSISIPWWRSFRSEAAQ